MNACLSTVLILAQDAPVPDAPQEPGWGGFLVLMLPLLLIIIVMQTIFGRGDSKAKARQEQLIASLKKNDPVITIGGILGSVVSVSEDKKEVTIRVDDNSRLKVLSSAIREVIVRDTKESSKSGE